MCFYDFNIHDHHFLLLRIKYSIKSHITKQLMHSFEVNIRICQPSKVLRLGGHHIRLGGHHFLGLTNPDVNLKRMHQLYNVINMRRQCWIYVSDRSR